MAKTTSISPPASPSLRSECPCCLSPRTSALENARGYSHCTECDLRFLNPELRLSREQESDRYRTHRNDARDEGYIQFLQPLFETISPRLTSGARGLDFGSGADSPLLPIFRGGGFAIEAYDPEFFPRPPRGPYDFIVCSETAEHFHHPAQEFRRLFDLLRPGGWLGIMTLFYQPSIDFAAWHYRRDPTHVMFYSHPSFQRLAQRSGFVDLTYVGERIALLRRP